MKLEGVLVILVLVFSGCSREESPSVQPEKEVTTETELPEIYIDAFRRPNFQNLALSLRVSEACPVNRKSLIDGVEELFSAQSLTVDNNQNFGLSVNVICTLREKQGSSSHLVLVKVKFIEGGTTFFRNYGETLRLIADEATPKLLRSSIEGYVEDALTDYVGANTNSTPDTVSSQTGDALVQSASLIP